MTIINPSTGEPIRELAEDSTASLGDKFQLLASAQPAWAGRTVGERVGILRRFSSLLEEQIEPLANILSTEVGKPLQQSRNEIRGACTRIKWINDNAARYLDDEVMANANGMEERICYEALGVICNISAWNYPYLVGVNVFVPALVAGNAVMYKPSEYATLTGLEIGRLLVQAGVPENVFQVAIGGRQTGEALLDMPFGGYFFTGSYKTGKYIYEKVSQKMVPCQCELGGKDPLYVADDISDVKAVAAATADGAFYNNGQSCCAVERIYVHERVYDRYVDEFRKEVASWKTGAPFEDGVYFGPVTREAQLDELEAQVGDALDKGATLLMGGARANGKGYYFQPTILTNVNHAMRVMRDESFGPVIGIMKVSGDDEAVSLMKDTEYGLTASVYSSDRRRAEAILRRVDTGTGYWNCCDRVSAAVPWSGRRHSGIGSTLSHAGIRAFTKPKALHLRQG